MNDNIKLFLKVLKANYTSVLLNDYIKHVKMEIVEGRLIMTDQRKSPYIGMVVLKNLAEIVNATNCSYYIEINNNQLVIVIH